ncbi:hypothetical protein DVH05_005553 [Phytophthora capsici]|nr:hypothetical protein DVH05_005553 [Phytophthora capsici]
MDLASNELAYMPPSSASSPPNRPLSPPVPLAPTTALVQQVTEQLLSQATQHLGLQQNQKRNNPYTPIRIPSPDEELLTAEQLQYLADEDARLQRRNTVVKELTAARQAAINRRLDTLVLKFEQLQQKITQTFNDSESIGNEDEKRWRVAVQQMTAKLDFVVKNSAVELHIADENVKWTRLLENLPMEERDYLGRAADEQFTEQMKYLRGTREGERVSAIQQHLHGILVLTAPHHNGQTVAKTSMHHSLRHLLQAFASIFHSCYDGFLLYGGQGFGVRREDVSVDRVTCTLPLVAADVTQFAAMLVQVVLFKYPFLQTSEAQRDAVERSVLGALFDALQPALHGLYVSSFQREDAIVEDVAEVARTNPLEFFEVKPLFRLDGSWSGAQEEQAVADGNERRLLTLRHYNAAIHHMNNFTSERSPYAKLERLAQVCEEIDRAIKLFYESQPEELRPAQEQLNVTTNDLCTLLSFILASAPSSCLHIFTQLAVLGSFTPQSIANGRQGFALAACVTAVHHLLR